MRPGGGWNKATALPTPRAAPLPDPRSADKPAPRIKKRTIHGCHAQVIDAMNLDSGVPLAMLKVDGGLTKSDVCMQIQSDVLGIVVGGCAGCGNLWLVASRTG